VNRHANPHHGVAAATSGETRSPEIRAGTTNFTGIRTTAIAYRLLGLADRRRLRRPLAPAG
jgi:hypothetical protein